MAKTMESVADTLRRARDVPDDSGMGARTVLPDLFGMFPIPPGEQVVENEPVPKDKQHVNDVPVYNLESHLKRFVIGTVTIDPGGRDRPPEIVEHDDSEEYEALLDDMLAGKAILRWEEKATLREGTFVVTVCYFTRKETAEPSKVKKNNEPFE